VHAARQGKNQCCADILKIQISCPGITQDIILKNFWKSKNLIFEVISLFSDLKLMRFGHIIFGLGKKV
jgi:hypothetical protein